MNQIVPSAYIPIAPMPRAPQPTPVEAAAAPKSPEGLATFDLKLFRTDSTQVDLTAGDRIARHCARATDSPGAKVHQNVRGSDYYPNLDRGQGAFFQLASCPSLNNCCCGRYFSGRLPIFWHLECITLLWLCEASQENTSATLWNSE